MKIVVTGASGFIGREIADELIKNNFKVIGLGRDKNKFPPDHADFEIFQCDLTTYESLIPLENEKEVEVIIHSAGLAHQFGDTKREEFEAVNINGTENILKLAVKLRVKHFILIGSTAVYGFIDGGKKNIDSPFLIDENSKTEPQTLYAESKLESEEICRKICEINQIPLTIFRLAPVIGEANVGNVARLISAIDKNRFVWIGNGENYKSLIYKRDVARACVEIVRKKKGNTEIFNLSAEPVLMKDFVEEIAGNLGKKILPFKIPAFLLRSVFRINSQTVNLKKIVKLSGTIEKWLSDDAYDSRKIADKYDFKPTTSISEAIKKQVDYYRKYTQKS